MICPNCGSNVSDKKRCCEHCGLDLALYTKVLKASNHYFNDGLAKAKVRDLSGAITALRNSLELNKKNTNSRNLLGLIYFEMGEPVDALSEWVISKHFQPEGNAADGYIGDVQNNPTKLENLNQAIKKYNTALSYAKQGSADLALLQLKKVISLNPHFLRAYLLVALLYLKGGENERAKRYLSKAGRIDVSNRTMLRYLREIEKSTPQKESEPNVMQEEEQDIPSIRPLSSYKEDKPNIMAYVNLVIGIVIGIAIMAILIVPNLEKKYAGHKTGDTNQSAMTAQLAEKNKEIASLKDDKKSLDQKVKDLEKQVSDTSESSDAATVYDSLFQANELYMKEMKKGSSEQNFEDTGDLLLKVDPDKLDSESAKSLYKQITDEIFPKLSTDLFKKGNDMYTDANNSGDADKYKDAIDLFKKALSYNPDNVDALYFMGRTYQKMDDKENAKTYYNKVINDYPDAKYRVGEATTHLKEIKD
jgi:tetratricopeptide (TPR) repeat protein